jgi:excisionase family DNA binding protein
LNQQQFSAKFAANHHYSDTAAMVQLLATTTDAARALGIGRTKLFELLKKDQLQAVRLGRKTLIPTSELERFAAALPPRNRQPPVGLSCCDTGKLPRRPVEVLRRVPHSTLVASSAAVETVTGLERGIRRTAP